MEHLRINNEYPERSSDSDNDKDKDADERKKRRRKSSDEDNAVALQSEKQKADEDRGKPPEKEPQLTTADELKLLMRPIFSEANSDTEATEEVEEPAEEEATSAGDSVHETAEAVEVKLEQGEGQTEEISALAAPETQASLEAEETPPPMDELSPAEERLVVDAYLAQTANEVAKDKSTAEEAESATEATAEDAAVDQFQQNLRSELQANQQTPVAESVSRAYQQTVEAVAPETEEEPANESPEPSTQPADAQPSAERATTNAMEYEEDWRPNEQATPQDSSTGNGGFGAAAPPFGGFRQFGGAGNPRQPGVLTGSESYRPFPGRRDEAAAETSAAFGGLLVGGIIGYLIGRRSGRIKTERRLNAVREKLETQVRAIQTQLAASETQIRTLVQKQTSAEQRIQQLQTNESLAAAAQTSAPLEQSIPLSKTGQESLTVPLHEQSPPGRRYEQPSIPLAEAAAALAVPLAEQLPQTTAKETAQHIKERIDKLPLAEVLPLAETIPAGASTVRSVFESKLISERGMRRIVAEHLAGKDVRPIVSEEVLIKEMSPELDPQFRDRPLQPLTRSVSPSQASSIGALSPSPPTASTLLNVAPPAPGSVLPSRDQSRTVSALVVANVAAFILLIALIVILGVVWLLR